MNPALLREEVQDFIQENKEKDLHEVIFSGSPFSDISIQEIAQQIVGWKIMQSKAPDFIVRGILFGPKIHLEQSSSKPTATYKSYLLPQPCESIIDLTGGFGIDLFYLLDQVKQAHYFELNSELCELVKHNFQLHNKSVLIHNRNSISFLQQTGQYFDCLMIDPSRRTSKGKVILLEESEPNIIEHWELLLDKAKRVIVKLSPMVDISYLTDRLSHVREIHVVAVKQDVKEIILLAESNYNGLPNVVSATVEGEQVKTYTAHDTKEISIAEDIEAYKYLYEPYSVLLKSNFQDSYAAKYGLLKVDPNTHLYFSDQFIATSMMKVFKIIDLPKLNRNKMRYLLPDQKVNVVCRNYPLKPAKVLQKLKFKQGGTDTLFCFRSGNERKYVLAKRME